MKTETGLKGLKIKGSVLLMLAASGALVPQLAFATSAGTVLRNSVTVDYEDNAANTYQETDYVDVTVDLLGDVTWGTAPAGQTVGQGDELVTPYTITLTNTGNGSDTYTLTDNTVQSCVAPSVSSDLTAESFSLLGSITLGATVTARAAVPADYDSGTDRTTIVVSNLNDADYVDGETVIINGNAYEVFGASDDNNPRTNDTLVVKGDATADVTAAGMQIGEQIVITYGASGTAGLLDQPSDDCQHDHNLLAEGTTPNDNAAATDTVSGWSTQVEAVDVAITKLVRNADDNDKNPVSGGIQYNGAGPLYFASGVTGNPGDTLEYLVVFDNTSNAEAVNVVFNDILPAFTTYVTTSLQVDTDGDGVFDVTTGGVGPLPDESEADSEGGIVTQSGQNITVFAGIGGDEDANDGGSVPSAQKTAVRYSVTID